MATKKTTSVKRTTKKEITSPLSQQIKTKSNPRFVLNLIIIILIGVTVFLLAKRYRSLVIAGVVNKSPITRMELNQVLTKRYGKAVLDELINEKILNILLNKLNSF